jgi:hypothetical protein
MSYTSILHILRFNIIQIVNVKKMPTDFYYIFLYKISVLKCLRIAQVQTEMCSIQVRMIN